MHILFLSCIEATELIEKKIHIQLSVKERLQLHMHKMMCDACHNYEKQSTIIEQGIAKSSAKSDKTPNTQALKKRITEELEKKTSK